MSTGLQPSAWHDLFVAAATAAAALLGLFFVAISIHIRDVESNPILRNRARINLQALAAVLVSGLAVLIPDQGDVWLGVELIAVMVVYFVVAGIGIWTARRAAGGLPTTVWVRLGLQNSLGLFAIAAGISLITGRGPGLFLEAPLMLIVLPVTTFNAWNVLYAPELRRQRLAD